MNIDLLRLVDRTLGIPWVHLLASFRGAGRPRDLRRILIIKFFGLGNLIMLTPAARALQSAFPRAEIDVLTFSQNGGIARMYRRLFTRAHLLPYSVFPMAAGIGRFILAHRNEYDLVIDAEQFIRFAAMTALLLAPRMLAGLPTPGSRKRRAYHLAMPYLEDRPLAREYLDLALAIARAFGRRAEEPDALLPPELDPAAAGRAAELVPNSAIGVCVGGRADAPAKRYPHWIPLLKRVRSMGVPIVYTGTPEEIPAVRAVHSEVGGVDLSGRLTQTELVEVIRRTSLYLSNDTGPLHLAAALGVWCVGFYGPTDPRVYTPYTPRRTIVYDPGNVPSITNRDEKTAGSGEVRWVSADEAFDRVSEAWSRAVNAAPVKSPP